MSKTKHSPERFLTKPIKNTRERIIVYAFDLFHRQGVHNTTVDQILKATDTGKGQFYHYFKSKDGLIMALFEEGRKKLLNQEIEDIGPIESWKDLRSKFDGFVEKMTYYNFCRSCPLGRLAAELPEDDQKMWQGVLMFFEIERGFIRDFIIKEKAAGRMKDNTDPDSLSFLVQSSIQGGSIVSKVHREEKPLRLTLDLCYEYLRSFVKKDEKSLD